MKKKTLKALKGSIAKWELNAQVEDYNDFTLGVHNCPLCDLFHHYDENDNCCNGCPVKERTRLEGCHGTPYPAASHHGYNWRKYALSGQFALVEKHKKLALAAAKREVKFLKSLLPKGETNAV